MKKADLKLSDGERIIFRLDTLTKFKWDKFYILPGDILQEEIERRIGVPWEYAGGWGIFSEGNMLLIFIRDNKIVSTSRFLAGDRRFEQFSIAPLKEFTPSSSVVHYIYKQFDASGQYNILIVPADKKVEGAEKVLLDKLRSIPPD